MLDDAQRKLALWRYDDNNVRPHSSVRNKTPAETRRALEQFEGSAHDALAQNETEENDVRSLECIERKRLAEVFCKVMPVSSHRHHALPMSL